MELYKATKKYFFFIFCLKSIVINRFFLNKVVFLKKKDRDNNG